MHELTKVNSLLSRYVLQFLDADAGRIEPLSTEDERALAAQLAEAAEEVRARAERREQHRSLPPAAGQRADDGRL